MGNPEPTQNEILAFIILTLTILSIPILIIISAGLFFLVISSVLQFLSFGDQANLVNMILYSTSFLVSLFLTRIVIKWIRK